MGLLDDAKGAVEGLTEKAKEAVDSIGADKVKEGIDTATDKVDEATGGKSAPITEKVDEVAGQAVDGLASS